MTDAGHTETPWQQGEKLGGNPLEIWSASGKHVVQVTKSPFWPYPDGPEAFHNAAFIVRSVNAHDDLVTALKEMRDAAVYLCAAQAENKLTEAADARFKKALETTRAALNKATEGR